MRPCVPTRTCTGRPPDTCVWGLHQKEVIRSFPFGVHGWSYWVYIVGPLAGALIAVGCAFVLRGMGGDAISYAAGSGTLDEGSLAARQRLSQAIDRGEVAPSTDTDTDTDTQRRDA